MRKILAIALVLCLFAAFTVGTAAAHESKVVPKPHVKPHVIVVEKKLDAKFDQKAEVYGDKTGLLQLQGLAVNKNGLITGQVTVAAACGDDAEIYSSQSMCLSLSTKKASVAPAPLKKVV